MSLRKIGTIVGAAALSLTLFAGTVFAETPPPEWEAPLKAKMERITQLQAQAKTLTAQLQQQTEANKALQQKLREAAVGNVGQQAEELKASFEAAVKPLREQSATLEEQFKAAKAAGDRVQAVVIRARIAELKLKVAAEMARLQPQRDQLKALQAEVQARKEALKASLAPLQPLIDQEKALHAANKELNGQAKAAMTAAQGAMKAGNWSSMLSTLDSVIVLRQQTVANLQQIAGLKTQVSTGLQAVIDAQK